MSRRTAADFAAALYTDAPADGEAESVEPMVLVELLAMSREEGARRHRDPC